MTQVTEAMLAAAFTEWDRRYREEPERFYSEATRLLKKTPEQYGDAAAPYLLALVTGLCSCGKPLEHLNADPDSADWACRVAAS